MAKIFVLMGKSASGKDTLYSRIIADSTVSVSTIVPYTTRPIRSGETEGAEYHFVTNEQFQALKASGKVVESRTYHTVHGDWSYFTADDGQFDLSGNTNYLLINTLEGFLQLADYFGREYVVPLYVEVEDGLRLERALARERAQDTPKYAELCRRFLADTEDFSENKLAAAGVNKRFSNVDMEQCLKELKAVIQ